MRHAQVADIDTKALPLPTPPLKRPRPHPIPQFEHVRPLPRGYGTRLELPDDLGAMLHDNPLCTEPNAVSSPPPCGDDYALTTNAPAATVLGFPQETYEESASRDRSIDSGGVSEYTRFPPRLAL